MAAQQPYQAISGLQASQAESIDALRASFQHLGANDDHEPLPLRPAQPRPLPVGLEPDEVRDLAPPTGGEGVSRMMPPSAPAASPSSAAEPVPPMPPMLFPFLTPPTPPQAGLGSAGDGLSAAPAVPAISGFEAADFEAAGLAPPPSMDEVSSATKTDTAATTGT